jgi:UDP-N-acetylglucosamine 2-epimerase (non-hydrolysing)
MVTLALVIGTRPQIIKCAPLVRSISRRPEIDLRVIHTGQHYDYEMSSVFLEELEMPEPYANLGVGSGSHVSQTAEMMMRLEKVLVELDPDLVVVPGDTNSALAGAVTSVKMRTPTAHLEAGARCYDMSMPEEVNRRLVDHLSSLLFSPSETCARNLREERVLGRVHMTGDTMYDAIAEHIPMAMKSNILERVDVDPSGYMVLTLHRAENVDDPLKLVNIVEAVIGLGNIPLVFPVHPRTRVRLESYGLLRKLRQSNHVRLLEPAGYFDMLKLLSEAILVLTDSGGIQKEAFWLGTPCVTLRDRTEWVETVELGANFLAGCSVDKIRSLARAAVDNAELRERIRRMPNPYGDGKASRRITELVLEYMSTGQLTT